MWLSDISQPSRTILKVLAAPTAASVSNLQPRLANMFFSNLYVPPASAPEGSGRECAEVILSMPPIEVVPMAQRSEAFDSVEDWTGITSTAVRRKLQNRLNQRASSKFASIGTEYAITWG